MLRVAAELNRLSVVLGVFAIGVTLGLTLTSAGLAGTFGLYSSDEYEAKVGALLRKVAAEVSELRGLELKKEIKLRVVSQEWFRQNFGRSYLEPVRGSVQVQEDIYKMLLMVPKNFSLLQFREKRIDDVAAFTSGGTIFVVREKLDPETAQGLKILAHEVVHALQSQHFTDPIRPTFDSKQAWTAVFEGDAEFTARLYVAFAEAGKGLQAHAAPRGAHRPGGSPFLRLSPYEAGLKFISALYGADSEGRAGSEAALNPWAAVNQAYRRPPSSTEQILHPEKYLAREEPLWVVGPGADGALWKKLMTETFGEQFIYNWLSQHLSPREARRAAEGWAGDSFSFYRGVRGELFTWRIAWDSDREAEEFAGAFAAMMRRLGAERLREAYWAVDREPYARVGLLLQTSGRLTTLAGYTGVFPQLEIKNDQVVFCGVARCPFVPPKA